MDLHRHGVKPSFITFFQKHIIKKQISQNNTHSSQRILTSKTVENSSVTTGIPLLERTYIVTIGSGIRPAPRSTLKHSAHRLYRESVAVTRSCFSKCLSRPGHLRNPLRFPPGRPLPNRLPRVSRRVANQKCSCSCLRFKRKLSSTKMQVIRIQLIK